MDDWPLINSFIEFVALCRVEPLCGPLPVDGVDFEELYPHVLVNWVACRHSICVVFDKASDINRREGPGLNIATHRLVLEAVLASVLLRYENIEQLESEVSTHEEEK